MSTVTVEGSVGPYRQLAPGVILRLTSKDLGQVDPVSVAVIFVATVSSTRTTVDMLSVAVQEWSRGTTYAEEMVAVAKFCSA